MKHLRIIVSVVMILCFAALSKAQSDLPSKVLDDCGFTTGFVLDTLERCYIHFRHDRAAIDSNYRDNRESLSAIRAALDDVAQNSPESIASIVIEGASSPIGHEVYNQRLSVRRARKVENFLRGIKGLEEVEMHVVGKGEDWETFTSDIRETYTRRNREQLLEILDLDLSARMKKQRIKAMESDSLTWRILVRDYMTTSRHAVAVVVIKKERIVDILPSLDPMKSCAVAPEKSLRQITGAEKPKSEKTAEPVPYIPRVPMASVRSNLLVPALNVGVEVPIGESWSVSADYYFPWIWPHERNRNCFEFLGWSAEGRYWFGRDRQPHDRLKGHSVGVYFAGGYYDFEKNYRGMQGEFISPGLDYTYSMAIGRTKRVHMQFTLAVGYIRSWGRTYNVYGDYGELYPDDGTVIWDYFGPTKAAVTIVVPFYRREGRR